MFLVSQAVMNDFLVLYGNVKKVKLIKGSAIDSIIFEKLFDFTHDKMVMSHTVRLLCCFRLNSIDHYL